MSRFSFQSIEVKLPSDELSKIYLDKQIICKTAVSHIQFFRGVSLIFSQYFFLQNRGPFLYEWKKWNRIRN